MSDAGRPRRRVEKPSPAPDYDRSMDAPGGPLGTDQEPGNDETRAMELDENADSQLEGAEFYLNERPPHHGSE